MFDEFGIPATFAFVGAFTQSRVEFARVRPVIDALCRAAPHYLGPALRDLDETHGSGWHGDDLVDLVGRSKTRHEIALHGVTHVPWTEMDDAAARAELALLQQLEGPIRQSKTFVYPRNLVAHTELLAKHGFEGYRTARSRSRLSSLLSEFNLFEAPEQGGEPNGIVPIPAGYFLNWRSGARRVVPPAVTGARAGRLLRAAAANGAVVHYWLHPENIASAPATLEVLKLLLHEVAVAREAGRCEIMTQAGYCRWIESLH